MTQRTTHATSRDQQSKPSQRSAKGSRRDAILAFGNKTVRLFGKQYTYAQVIGRVASLLSVIMYVSYIPQIAQNLAGNPANPAQPLAAFFNCMLWTCYGIMIEDKPILIANIPGIFLAAACSLTALIRF